MSNTSPNVRENGLFPLNQFEQQYKSPVDLGPLDDLRFREVV